MAKGQTNIIGISPGWRSNKTFDAFRVNIWKDDENTHISAKTHPILKQINDYLRIRRLKRVEAEKDPTFLALTSRLFHNLKDIHGLKEYRSREWVAMQKKGFPWDVAIKEFEAMKAEDTAISAHYRSRLERFWLPFFSAQGCKHPNDFKKWRKEAIRHVKTANKERVEEKYSVNSWTDLTTALNEFLKFCLENEWVDQSNFFSVHISKRQKRKEGRSSQSRGNDTYSYDELIEIKTKIDTHYDVTKPEDLKWKLRAYACYLGLGTGLRRGNILGLRAKDLNPDPEQGLPHVETGDNIVPAWSRGKKGKHIGKLETKGFVGTVKLPLIQPKREILQEVCRLLKEHIPPDNYILECYPTTVAGWWEKIAKDCGFKYLTPHQWKHSYATLGTLNLKEWYKGNPFLLQKCCLHQKYETTLGYLNQKGDRFLRSFED